MQVVVDELLTSYSLKGSGKKSVVLLHGWGDSLKSFNQLADRLSKDYSVVSLDLPGFGGTQAPGTVWGLEEYSRFIAKFLTKINLEPIYAIIGHSNGGSVAIKGLATGDLAPSKLILLASAGIRNDQQFRRLVVKLIAKTGKVLTFWLPKRHKQKLQKKLYGVVGSDMLVTPTLQETFKKTVRQDVQQDAKNLTVPTLLIYGDEDKATPVRFGEIYKGLIEDSKLEVIHGAGHFVHHDQADEVESKIKAFLK